MSSFRQICPGCKATLELPIQADGKTAVCPACDAHFVANAGQGEQAAIASVDDSLDGSAALQTSVPQTSVPPKPVTVKHYRQVPIESIWDGTRSILLGRRRRLFLPFLVPSVLVLLGMVFPLSYLSGKASSNLTSALTWLALLSPWFLMVTVYCWWFALNLSLEVCDAGPDTPGEDAPEIRSRFLPKWRVFLALLIVLTIAIAFAAVVISVATVIIDSASQVNAIEIRLLATIGTFVIGILALTLAAMRLWPMVPLAMEGQMGKRILGESLAMTRSNRMSSFLLVATVFFIVGFGFSLMGLGLMVSIPIAALMLVVGFRMIVDRRIPAFQQD